MQHHAAGRLAEAKTIYQRILHNDPHHPVALHLLGVIAHQVGKSDIAVKLITQALAVRADYPEAHYNLGSALQEMGRLDEAVECYRRTVAMRPDYAEAYNNLGLALHELGRMDEAVASYEKALAIKPDLAEAHNNLGNTLINLGRRDEAVASYRKAVAVKPDLAEAHNNLGNALNSLGRLDEAVQSFHRALAIMPEYVLAHNNLANALNSLGRLDEAVECLRKALAIKPDSVEANSNLLLIEQYRPGHDAETLYRLHCEWDERLGRAFRSSWPKHRNVPAPDRRLRVGFVSPDLGRHPVGYFVVRAFENIPATEIEMVAYSDRVVDDLTERIKAAVAVWRDVRGMSDEELTRTILDDEIDILVDLAGHSARNRLLVFARKPAPVQVTWAGYVGTTGLSAIDYLVSDPHSTRPDEEKCCRETVVRMPYDYVCYDPPVYAPEVGPLPFRRNGVMTFGSFNNPGKINAEVASVWARILQAVANSRLMIKYRGIDSAASVERLTTLFEAEGIDQSRLTLEGQSPHADLLARYNDVDIALDPFPYSGGLTTCEASWMGVPVITVPGQTFASRHSLVHLSAIGLPELVASDRDDYVKLAVALANDADGLARLRAGLRAKMAGSPLCDGRKFAEGFAAIMRNIWRNWCVSQESDAAHPRRSGETV